MTLAYLTSSTTMALLHLLAGLTLWYDVRCPSQSDTTDGDLELQLRRRRTHLGGIRQAIHWSEFIQLRRQWRRMLQRNYTTIAFVHQRSIP